MTLCLTCAQPKPTEPADLSLASTVLLCLKTSPVAKLSYADVVMLVRAPAFAGEQAAPVEEALAPAAAEAAPVKPVATGRSAEEVPVRFPGVASIR